jgi:hypothetical protein
MGTYLTCCLPSGQPTTATTTAFCHRGHKDHKGRQRQRRKFCYGKRPTARTQRTSPVEHSSKSDAGTQASVTINNTGGYDRGSCLGSLCVLAVVVAFAVTKIFAVAVLCVLCELCGKSRCRCRCLLPLFYVAHCRFRSPHRETIQRSG